MTIPWLMNCGHRPDGWCLECVAKQGEELQQMRLLAADPHYIHKVKEAMGPLSLWTEQGLKDEIAKHVRSARTEVEQKWIPVSERLPEPNGPDVIVLGERFMDRCAWSASPVGFVGRSWAKLYSITHWLPMPSIPSPQREPVMQDALALTEKAVEDQVYELVLGSLGDLVKAAEQHIKPGMDGYAQLAFAQEVLRR